MFANRFTAFVDACSLTSALKRNLLATLAEHEFYRLRWSQKVLDETKGAINAILDKKGFPDAAERAARAIKSLETAFDDAMVENYEHFECICTDMPDQNDIHVVAAALKTRASIIVTENLKDFPPKLMGSLNIEVLTTDAFVANTIALDEGRAVAVVRKMRERFKNPEITQDVLLQKMEANGMTQTVDALKQFSKSI